MANACGVCLVLLLYCCTKASFDSDGLTWSLYKCARAMGALVSSSTASCNGSMGTVGVVNLIVLPAILRVGVRDD